MSDTNITESFPVETFKEAAVHLRRPFTPEAVRFKVQTGTLAVAYIDARLVAERLNLVCPHLWSDTYEVAGKGMLCHLTLDGITRSDFGEGYVGKGLYSDAFKRAAVKFGVGVSLYSIPSTWLEDGHLNKNGSINANGLNLLRSRYKTWLTDIGGAAFGEPLDHGDTEDSAGDVEAQVTVADAIAEGEPTDDQREEVKRQVKRLALKGEDKDLLFAKFGVQSGVASTHAQVEKLIEHLKGMDA